YYKNLLNWLDEQKNLHVFVLDGISSRNEDKIKFISDIHHPTEIFPEKDLTGTYSTQQIENVKFQFFNGTFLQQYDALWQLPLDTTIINLLRKRNLNPIITPDSYNNSYLIETTPDIMVISGVGNSTYTNYKGTTVLTNGSFKTEPIYWVINLQTRETFKIDLS
ncbi:MAG: hypothetical protein HYS80_00710, partial [Candidatus Aenigmarchaeota archaeon]|nr:hypothetical protein [Candidatus Aenigmarchaeota archaeon]